MLIYKSGISIEVVHLFLSKGNTVSPVKWANVVLNAFDHFAPGVANLLWRLPTKLPWVLKEGRVCVSQQWKEKKEKRKGRRKIKIKRYSCHYHHFPEALMEGNILKNFGFYIISRVKLQRSYEILLTKNTQHFSNPQCPRIFGKYHTVQYCLISCYA